LRRCAAMRAGKERKRLEDVKGEPVRGARVVEIVIRDTHRPRREIRMEAEEMARGWGRWEVWENGGRVGRRRFGSSKIAGMIARSLM